MANRKNTRLDFIVTVQGRSYYFTVCLSKFRKRYTAYWSDTQSAHFLWFLQNNNLTIVVTSTTPVVFLIACKSIVGFSLIYILSHFQFSLIFLFMYTTCFDAGTETKKNKGFPKKTNKIIGDRVIIHIYVVVLSFPLSFYKSEGFHDE